MKRLRLLTLFAASALAAASCNSSGANADSGGAGTAAQAAQAAPSGEGAEQEGAEAAQAQAAPDEAAPAANAPAEAAQAEPAPPEAQREVPPVGSETPEQIFAAIEGDGDLWVTFVTTMGEIECDLYEDKAPNTVANFVGLATGNKTYLDDSGQARRGNFFDGLIFHRVIPEFMIQGGDPTGTGRGGPGYRFADEFHPQLRHDRGGLLSMANAGPNTNGSQFFVTEVPTPHLDNRHTVFGACTSTDVVERIARVSVGPSNRPLQDVVMERVVISRR